MHTHTHTHTEKEKESFSVNIRNSYYRHKICPSICMYLHVYMEEVETEFLQTQRLKPLVCTSMAEVY